MEKLNEVDNRGDLPLDLALSTKQESIAMTLVNHKVDVNRRDNAGKCLLHKAIKRGQWNSLQLQKWSTIMMIKYLTLQPTPPYAS